MTLQNVTLILNNAGPSMNPRGTRCWSFPGHQAVDHNSLSVTVQPIPYPLSCPRCRMQAPIPQSLTYWVSTLSSELIPSTSSGWSYTGGRVVSFEKK